MSLRADVEATLYRYAWCYDEGDIDGLVQTFCEDGIQSGETSINACRGRAEIHAFQSKWRGHRRSLGQQPRHMLSGTIVTPISETEVESRCYMLLIVTSSDGTAQVDHSGRYLDRLVLVDGEWKFAERKICVDRDVAFPGRLTPPRAYIPNNN